ncbi:hypothetical protein [Microbacterium sp. NPDC090003]|uniref:hypothetical protein n=1 Tax=Microbacterium sp. NPDC090003 TaxID=3364203 RepID=UPI003829C510
MNDIDVSIDERIRAFAAAVRTHLDDLPEEELDEIMSGLAADLADQAADNGGVLEVSDPAVYADELRSAAGLPPRDADRPVPPLSERIRDGRARAAESIRRSPFGAWLLDLALALRPVWWVLRGYGMYVTILFLIVGGYGRDHWMVPASIAEWGALGVLVIVSVQWGRGQWLPRNPLRHMRTAASVLAVIALLGAIPAASTPRVQYTDDDVQPSGLLLDGVQINNIFAYDAEGNLIDRVQLFTSKGTPINLYGQEGGQYVYDENGEIVETENGGQQQYGIQDDGTRATIPSDDYRGRPVWNIYPLDETDIDPTTGIPGTATVKRPQPPFQKAPDFTAMPTPTPTPTPNPNPGSEAPTEPQPTETPAP